MITHQLTVSGREVISLDNLLAAKRYGEERFRSRRYAACVIKWEPTPEGELMLTYKRPGEKLGDFHTTGYKIAEVGAS